MKSPRWSLILSAVIHAAIVIAGVVAMPQAQHYVVEERDMIPIELVGEITEKSQRQAVKKDAPPPKPDQKIAPPKVEPKPEAKPQPKAAPEPKPEPEPEPKPEPKPEAKPEPAPDPKELAKLLEKTEPTPAPKPKPKPPAKPKPKKELNVDELAALLNKIPDAEPQPDPAQEEGTPAQGPVDSLKGSDGANSADLVDYLASATSQCWNPPTGVMEAQDLVISIQIDFAQDGSVTGTPQVMNSSSNPLFGVASAAAVRAIMRCAPYDKLPPERYEEWRTTTFNFNPARMFAP